MLKVILCYSKLNCIDLLERIISLTIGPRVTANPLITERPPAQCSHPALHTVVHALIKEFALLVPLQVWQFDLCAPLCKILISKYEGKGYSVHVLSRYNCWNRVKAKAIRGEDEWGTLYYQQSLYLWSNTLSACLYSADILL